MSTGVASCWKVDASNSGFHGTLAYPLAISPVSLVRLRDWRSFGLAWGLMVGLQGLPATRMQLGPGAGWLAGFQWKPLDIRDTQPPFQDVVVKCNLPKLTTKLGAAQIDSAVTF